MTLMSITTITSLVVIFSVCAALIFNEHYEDGLLGRIALVMIMLGAGMLIARLIGDRVIQFGSTIDPAGEWMIIGLAVFISRHFYRFKKAVKHPEFRWKMNK